MGKKNIKKKQKKSLLQDEQQKAAKTVTSVVAEDKKETDAAHSIDRLLDKAEQLIDEFNYELAQKFCQRALETEPDNVRALETSASLLLELGNAESAKHCLGRAVEVCPESGFSKYMTLGQLMEGATAVQCYQKGIELMIKEKESKEAEEVAAACSNDRSASEKDISSAYCAIAEIYLTDCCFDDQAEEKCKEFVEKAIASDPDNAEAWQVKASFLMSKNEKEEAKAAMKKSVSLWLPKLQAVDTGELPEEEFDPVEVCSVPYTARVQSGKILIEMEEYEEATEVLETLLDEDDEVPDVWYLLGWANYLHGKEYYSNSRHYLQKAKEVYVKVKYEDAELLGHIDELIQELGPDDAEETENGTVGNLEIESSGEEDMDQ
ncbi:probable assembly chaperone of rpl4 [Aplysia californica]|uniref:Probable assembly chaperone of rpl4 n=1 Tax=Aplysia californica TaxID=6500 RepID=A0ABM0JLE0_APLCA|nr:probable assembly chaperone of rpl4 [Aplysia californica]